MTTPETPATTLARFDHAWAELDETVKGLSERELTDIRDPVGWSAKDHLMHVAAWEPALLAKLDGRPRHEALGIDEVTDRSGDDDTINAAIFAGSRHRPPREVLDAVRGTHAATRARLAALVDGTAGRSFVSTTPDAHASARSWPTYPVTPSTTNSIATGSASSSGGARRRGVRASTRSGAALLRVCS